MTPNTRITNGMVTQLPKLIDQFLKVKEARLRFEEEQAIYKRMEKEAQTFFPKEQKVLVYSETGFPAMLLNNAGGIVIVQFSGVIDPNDKPTEVD